MKHRKTTLLFFGLWGGLSTFTACFGAINAAAQESPIAFRGAVVETMGKAGVLENGVVVIQDGKITAVGKYGKDTAVPENARVIDVRGKTILPGFVDPYHTVRLPGAVAATTRTITIRGRTITLSTSTRATSGAFSKVMDSFYPYDLDFRPLARSGITHANLAATGYGQAALVRITPRDPADMMVNGQGVLYASVTNNSSSLNVLRTALAAASRSDRLSAQRNRSRSSTSRGSSGRPTGAQGGATRGSSSGRTTPRPSGPSLSLIRDVSAGKRPAIVNANNSAAILHLFKLLTPHRRVKLVLISSGANIHQTLDEIKKRKPFLVLPPAIDYAPNTRNRICVPREVHEAGLEFAFSFSLNRSDLNASQDAPLFPVALMVKYGLPRQTALAALTSSPAKMLGLEKTHGSIETGKLANLLIFDGDPLDPASQLEQVFVEGRLVHAVTKDKCSLLESVASD